MIRSSTSAAIALLLGSVICWSSLSIRMREMSLDKLVLLVHFAHKVRNGTSALSNACLDVETSRAGRSVVRRL